MTDLSDVRLVRTDGDGWDVTAAQPRNSLALICIC